MKPYRGWVSVIFALQFNRDLRGSKFKLLVRICAICVCVSLSLYFFHPVSLVLLFFPFKIPVAVWFSSLDRYGDEAILYERCVLCVCMCAWNGHIFIFLTGKRNDLFVYVYVSECERVLVPLELPKLPLWNMCSSSLSRGFSGGKVIKMIKWLNFSLCFRMEIVRWTT